MFILKVKKIKYVKIFFNSEYTSSNLHVNTVLAYSQNLLIMRAFVAY